MSDLRISKFLSKREEQTILLFLIYMMVRVLLAFVTIEVKAVSLQLIFLKVSISGYNRQF